MRLEGKAARLEVLTITDRPLVYTILSLLELSLVAAPRAVAGLTGCKTPFLKDIVLVYGDGRRYMGEDKYGCGCDRCDCDTQIEIVRG